MSLPNLKLTSPMTGVAFKLTLSAMGLTQQQVADAWGYTHIQISRWANGKAPVPAWVPYALGIVSFAPGGPVRPAEPPKPSVVVEDAITPAAPAKAPPKLVIPAKPADDGRPFRYMGGRKVYLD